MIEIVIGLSLVVVAVAYLCVSIAERSFINVLSPSLLVGVPANYVLELAHIHYFGHAGSPLAYAYCYFTYAACTAVLAGFYLLSPARGLKLPLAAKRRRFWLLPYLFLGVAFLLYLPILVEFRDLIGTPREIYVRVRTGYGLSFFLSSTLTYLAFILFLFKKPRPRLELYLVFLLCALLLALHGSKAHVLTLIFIGMMYRVYVRGRRVNLGGFISYGLLLVIGVTLLFRATLPPTMAGNLLRGMSQYSDYTRNAVKVIDSDLGPYWGRLTVEEAVYSRVPRALYPDKPKDFGTFYLAKRFYPAWFDADTGSPAFGIGVQYADFGPLAVVYLLAWSAVTGVLLKSFVARLRRYRAPADFLIVLFLSGIGLIPIGVGYLLPEHLFLAGLLAVLTRFRLLTPQRDPPAAHDPPRPHQPLPAR